MPQQYRRGQSRSDSGFDHAGDAEAHPAHEATDPAVVAASRTLNLKGRLVIRGKRFDTGKASRLPDGWTDCDDSPVTITEKGGRKYAQLNTEGKLIVRGILVDNARTVDVTDWARSDVYDIMHPFEAQK